MYYNNKDKRIPLGKDTVISVKDTASNNQQEYVIDSIAGSGGFALMYIAHEKSNPHHYFALKELFPRALENAVAERREDGKIVIYNPLIESDDCDNQALWNQMESHFEREVHLTQKAAAVYDSNGRIVAQNNPDVLGIYGPFIAGNGNRYIAIDTKAGKSLQQFIDNGWESNADRGNYRNNLIDEILDVLIKVTQRLTSLHGDHRMYHLDLSPSNIYVSYINGGMDLEPTIIDYGSAYDRDNPKDLTSHRFTCNPYSSPEVNALAELNNQNAGYYVDATSDTYSIVAMLFYAILGELYTGAKIYDASWRQKIRELYPEAVYNDFAELLIDFFCCGLASDQAERYVTIQSSVNRKQESLYATLLDLKKAYKAADMLSTIPSDELMSYLILDKYPLFKYFSKGQDIHVLCLGSGVFVNRMILSMISTGQMIDRKLFIHVVSGDADQYKERLVEQAPLLNDYADLGGQCDNTGNKYVTFTFETIADLKDEVACKAIAEKYGEFCRYVIISLGANNDNINLARQLAREIGMISNKKTIINYYISEESALNIRATVEETVIPTHVAVNPFGNRLGSYNKDVHMLGMKAFRVHYLYEKLYDKKVSKQKALRKFISDEYSQRSSTSAAVHIDYKLASLGISTADYKKLKRSKASVDSTIINQYVQILTSSNGEQTTQYNQLLQLEHTRWMMFMIADGYRLATAMDHEKYSFRQVGSKFNKAFKCTDEKVKTHHCLVPCSAEGIKLPRNHEEWDKYSTIDQIEQTDYDPLDKASLTVHLIASERTKRPETIGRIRSLVEYDLQEKLYLASGEIGLKSEYEQFKEWIMQVLQHKKVRHLNEKLENIQTQFAFFNIDISDIIEKLRNHFSIFTEYQKYNDYKEPDRTIIEHLLWVKFGEKVTLLKATDKTVLSNIASPLLMEPKKLVYLGEEQPLYLTEFFEKHGDNTKVFFEKCDLKSLQDITAVLAKIIEASSSETFVIDVTGDNPLVAIAATKLEENHKNVGVVCSDVQDNNISLMNIANYPYALIHRLNTSISASEVFELYGANEKSSEASYMLGLSNYMESLWAFYQNHCDEWEMISSFFESFGRGSSEFHISNFSIAEARWSPYKKQVSFDACKKAGIFDILFKLEENGIIKNYSCMQTEAFTNISFMYPVVAQGKYNNIFYQKFGELLNNLGDTRLVCAVKSQPNNVFDVDMMSGLKVFRNFKQSGMFTNRSETKSFAVKEMEAPLKELEERQLISSLEFKSTDETYYVNFTYNSSAIRDCLTTAGNILEAYVWYEAEKTGIFDSVKTNYSFMWANSTVSNELDIILTKGLTTIVCSCKTAKMAKEHLYEVAELSRRFSVGTKPVIIYSSEKSIENGRISVNIEAMKERAKEMGIYLIDKDMLNNDLGRELVRIAQAPHPQNYIFI